MRTIRLASASMLVLALLVAGSPAARAACGDGVVDPGEPCDPGRDPGQCCTAACEAVADGTSCLTIGGTCSSGVCVAPFSIERVRIRNHSARTLDSGSIVARGRFPTDPPADHIDATVGITLHVTDGLNVDRTFHWDSANSSCITYSNGAVRCTHPDGQSAKVQLLAPRAGSTTWAFKVRLKSLDIEAPFSGPVTLTMSTGSGVDRHGSIDTCTVSSTTQALNCAIVR
jgi:hypothetical protein